MMRDLFQLFVMEEINCPTSEADRGAALQRDRLVRLADVCCQRHSGDLIEIGCYTGATSSLLVKVARRHDRKLICVDNWKGGDDYKLDEIGVIFKQQMSRDSMVLIEGDAHAESIIQKIRERRYCFAFSDDGHSYEAHLSELNTLMPIVDGVIAVDDVYLPEVRQAIADAIKNHPEWTELFDGRLRESWLVQ